MSNLLSLIIGISIFVSLEFTGKLKEKSNKLRNATIGFAFAGVFFLATYFKKEYDESRKQERFNNEQRQRLFDRESINEANKSAQDRAREQVKKDSILRQILKKRSF